MALDAATSTTRLPVDTRQLPWINRLARDYAWDFERLAGFYRGAPGDARVWREVIAGLRTRTHPRREIAALLAAQQRRRGAPDAAVAASARLADPHSVAIVTGQQAGLFGGPLFTLLKALTALALADHVRETYGVPTVAVFWVDAEDHDWAEVRACGVLDADAAYQTVALDDLPGAGRQAVADLQLDERIAATIDALEPHLAPAFGPEVAASLRATYRAGVGVADAFATWLERLLGPRGLVVYDASDPAAKPLAADLFAREVRLGGATSARAAAAGEALEALGYHAQVSPTPGNLAIASLQPGREPIAVSDGHATIGDRTETFEALEARVRRDPAVFGPNVLLRPLVQDTLFPTACYVAGPSELAYLGQLREVYRAFDVAMPIVWQRASATIVDGNAWRFLTRPDVAFASLKARDEAALNQILAAALPPTVDAAFAAAASAIDAHLDRVAAEAAAVDVTLGGAAASARGRMQDDLQKLRGKVLQAAKRRDETLRRQFHHAQAQAFPHGEPQERAVAGVSFLGRYGPSLVERLAQDVPFLEQGTHWLLTV